MDISVRTLITGVLERVRAVTFSQKSEIEKAMVSLM